MLFASASLCAIGLLLLGAGQSALAAPAACSHHHTQVQHCRSHLDDHQAFCCSYLQGHAPPRVGHAGNSDVCSSVHYVITTDATAYRTTTRTAVQAVTTTSTHTTTVGSTATSILPPTATDTITSTLTSTTYIQVREDRRRSVSTKPAAVEEYSDEVVIDACLLLLYNWYAPPSKCPPVHSPGKGKGHDVATATIHKTLTKTSTAQAVRKITKVDVKTSTVTTLTTITIQPDATTTAFVASTTHYERGGYLEPTRNYNFVAGSSDGEALYYTNDGTAFYRLDTNTGYLSSNRNFDLLLSTGPSDGHTIVVRSPAEIQAGGYAYLVCSYADNGGGGLTCTVSGAATSFYYCPSESSTLVYIGATPPLKDCQAVGIQLDDQK